jgi:hypothetical protein
MQPNNSLEVFTWLGVGLAGVLLFGTAVFVHEFGHFWMARRRGLKSKVFRSASVRSSLAEDGVALIMPGG